MRNAINIFLVFVFSCYFALDVNGVNSLFSSELNSVFVSSIVPPVTSEDTFCIVNNSGTEVMLFPLVNDSFDLPGFLSADIISGPFNGSAYFGGDTLYYTPGSTFTGWDDFIYSITDVNGTSNPNWIRIQVLPDSCIPSVANFAVEGNICGNLDVTFPNQSLQYLYAYWELDYVSGGTGNPGGFPEINNSHDFSYSFPIDDAVWELCLYTFGNCDLTATTSCNFRDTLCQQFPVSLGPNLNLGSDSSVCGLIGDFSLSLDTVNSNTTSILWSPISGGMGPLFNSDGNFDNPGSPIATYFPGSTDSLENDFCIQLEGVSINSCPNLIDTFCASYFTPLGPPIHGPLNSCESGTDTFTVMDIYSTNLIWQIFPSATFTGTLNQLPFNNGNNIEIVWGTASPSLIPDTLICTGISLDGCPWESQFLVFNHPSPDWNIQSGLIDGPNSICNSDTFHYSVNEGVNPINYSWNVAGGNIIGNADSSEIGVVWSSPGSGLVQIRLEDSLSTCDTSMIMSIDILPELNLILQGDTIIDSLSILHPYLTFPYPEGSFSWEINPPSGGEIIGVQDTNIIQISWLFPGTYMVKLRVEIGTGCSDSVEIPVLVLSSNLPPIAEDDSIIFTSPGTGCVYPLLNDEDPDGAFLFFNLLHPPNNGTLDAVGQQLCFEPEEGIYGWDSLIYEICDAEIPQLCDTAIIYIYTEDFNYPPVVETDSAFTESNSSTIIYPLANDYDPDGNLDPSGFQINCHPQNGSTSFSLQTWELTYNPDSNFIGWDSLCYSIPDDEGTTSEQVWVYIYVEYSGTPPVAISDTFELETGNCLSIWPLINDSDPNGDSLLFYPIESPQLGGIFWIGLEGVYCIDNQTSGIDEFSYSVCDTGGLCDTATILINILQLGLNNLDQMQGFEIIPNPFNSYFTLENPFYTSILSVELIGLDGKIQKLPLKNQQMDRLSFKDINIPSGLYFLKVTRENDVQIIKCIRR